MSATPQRWTDEQCVDACMAISVRAPVAEREWVTFGRALLDARAESESKDMVIATLKAEVRAWRMCVRTETLVPAGHWINSPERTALGAARAATDEAMVSDQEWPDPTSFRFDLQEYKDDLPVRQEMNARPTHVDERPRAATDAALGKEGLDSSLLSGKEPRT